jgi:TonB family protein
VLTHAPRQLPSWLIFDVGQIMLPRVLAVGLALSLSLVCGCATASRSGGCVVDRPRTPLVTLESVSATNDSPSWGYPLLPFPIPVYPWQMNRAGITGDVVVRVVVGPDGVVRSSTIVKSTYPEFEDPVLAATQQWRFLEFPDIGVKEYRGMILECAVKFAFDES